MGKSKEVEAWLAAYENPMKPVVMRMREIILAADERMGECIKWQAPTFTFEGNLASFFPKSKQHASLMFHVGAQIPGTHPRLEGTGDTGRVMKIGSITEVEEARADLETIVQAWCSWRSEGDAKPAKRAAKAKRTKTTTAAKAKRAAKAPGKRAAKKAPPRRGSR